MGLWSSALTNEFLLSEFKDAFEGIGKLQGGKYHIELKPDAQPVQHTPWAAPEKKEAYELERLCSLDIIEPVGGHTDWINSIILVAKPDGSIRLCLDPKHLLQYVHTYSTLFHISLLHHIQRYLHG